MERIRFSIAGLMGLVVLAAIGLTSLRRPTELWASGVFSLAVGMDFAAVTAVIALKGRARSIWAGVAVCSSGYHVLCLAPWFEANVGTYLITSPLIKWGYHQNSIDPVSFFRIAHSLFGLAAGLAGGLLAGALAQETEARARSTISITDQT